eukprot:TRINITY_DN96032_c0_g1_i1.p1 TRINITY_DN96032_c0_g1~~TRINITY_DN96032_c0_g1_i1.p1  ORF type:complete len:626 (+),score=76.19 TRINITY_DN96032_c0_g1_i1:63-1940(+)
MGAEHGKAQGANAEAERLVAAITASSHRSTSIAKLRQLLAGASPEQQRAFNQAIFATNVTHVNVFFANLYFQILKYPDLAPKLGVIDLILQLVDNPHAEVSPEQFSATVTPEAAKAFCNVMRTAVGAKEPDAETALEVSKQLAKLLALVQIFAQDESFCHSFVALGGHVLLNGFLACPRYPVPFHFVAAVCLAEVGEHITNALLCGAHHVSLLNTLLGEKNPNLVNAACVLVRQFARVTEGTDHADVQRNAGILVQGGLITTLLRCYRDRVRSREKDGAIFVNILKAVAALLIDESIIQQFPVTGVAYILAALESSSRTVTEAAVAQRSAAVTQYYAALVLFKLSTVPNCHQYFVTSNAIRYLLPLLAMEVTTGEMSSCPAIAVVAKTLRNLGKSRHPAHRATFFSAEQFAPVLQRLPSQPVALQIPVLQATHHIVCTLADDFETTPARLLVPHVVPAVCTILCSWTQLPQGSWADAELLIFRLCVKVLWEVAQNAPNAADIVLPHLPADALFTLLETHAQSAHSPSLHLHSLAHLLRLIGARPGTSSGTGWHSNTATDRSCSSTSITSYLSFSSSGTEPGFDLVIEAEALTPTPRQPSNRTFGQSPRTPATAPRSQSLTLSPTP